MVSLAPIPLQDAVSRISATNVAGMTCLVQGDTTGVIVLGSTGLTLFGPHDASHTALFLQVGDTAVPLGYPETRECLSTCLPGSLPRRVTLPTSQEGDGVKCREGKPPSEVYSKWGQCWQQGRHNPQQVT